MRVFISPELGDIDAGPFFERPAQGRRFGKAQTSGHLFHAQVCGNDILLSQLRPAGEGVFQITAVEVTVDQERGDRSNFLNCRIQGLPRRLRGVL